VSLRVSVTFPFTMGRAGTRMPEYAGWPKPPATDAVGDRLQDFVFSPALLHGTTEICAGRSISRWSLCRPFDLPDELALAASKRWSRSKRLAQSLQQRLTVSKRVTEQLGRIPELRRVSDATPRKRHPGPPQR
jgi:hypothetical protein